jgi:hypothetical protein
MFRHRENQPELEAQAGHEHVRLVSRFPSEGQRVIARQFGAKTFSDQSDLGGADAVDRAQKRRQDGGRHHKESPRLHVEDHGESLLAAGDFRGVYQPSRVNAGEGCPLPSLPPRILMH